MMATVEAQAKKDRLQVEKAVGLLGGPLQWNRRVGGIYGLSRDSRQCHLPMQRSHQYLLRREHVSANALHASDLLQRIKLELSLLKKNNLLSLFSFIRLNMHFQLLRPQIRYLVSYSWM